MFNIAPFVTKFVRSLHGCDENIEIPYSMTQFGVVLMADVVGFSKLTTLATEKGASSPEAIASEIGEYMGECIKIIEFYDGDVVKFLGDALLVCFQPSLTNEHRRSSSETMADDGPADLSQRQRHVLVRKAIECGLQLLARQSHFRVYLTAEEIIRHRGPGGQIERHHYLTDNKDQQQQRRRLSLFDSLHEGKSGSSRKKSSNGDSIYRYSDSNKSASSDDNNNNNNNNKKNNSNSSSSNSNNRKNKKRSNTLKSQLQNSQAIVGGLHQDQNLWEGFNLFKKKSYDKILSKFSDRRRSSNNSSQNTDTHDIKSIDLELHIAVSCGNVTNIILGDMEPDGAISEIPLFTPEVCENIGFGSKDGINNNKSGSHTDGSGDKPGAGNTGQSTGQGKATGIAKSDDDYFLRYRGRLEYAVCGEAVESLDKALSAAKAGEISITPETFLMIDQKTTHLSYDMRDGYYVVKGFDFDKSDYVFRNQQNQLNPASQLKVEPLIPKTRDNSLLNLTQDCSLQYYKYLNRSSLYRLQHSINGSFPAQFREATIMFISLGKIRVDEQDGFQKAQKALYLAIRRLVKYEGMLQQFAVDDKGATILGIFGLPPLSHESEAIFAAKAAIKLRDEYRKFLPDFSIALASGGIFNAILPMDSPYRRDTAIAGDAIIIAVRMLKFPFAKRNIVCDYSTMKQMEYQCEFENFGDNYVKGKKNPVEIYCLLNFNYMKNKKVSHLPGASNLKTFVGYQSELENALGFLDSWQHSPNHHLMVVLGNMGSGKSLFCRTLHDQFQQNSDKDTVTCWTLSIEVEKSTKYYTIRNLVTSLFELIDSDTIPELTNGNTKDISNSRYGSSLLASQDTGFSSNGSGFTMSSNDSQRNSHHYNPTPLRDIAIEHATQQQDSTTSVSSVSNQSSPFMTPIQHQILMHQKEGSEQRRTQESMDENNDFGGLIARCLHKCGENEALLPLFRDMSIDLGGIENNRHTKHIDGRARDILLMGAIVRMVQYLSQFVNILMICDDMQWSDSPSLSLIQQLHQGCRNIMILVAARQSKNMDMDFIDEFCETGTVSQITLNGLGTSDIEKIILQNCGDGVDRVNPSIVNVVQDRTSGNPLYVTNMAILLNDFDHVIKKDGELIPTSNQFDLENFLGNFNYSRVIKMQFDRLNSNYQEFLTIASCLDQYFTLYEVGAAIQPSNTICHQTDPKVVYSLLKRYDVYNFLNHTECDNGNNTNRKDKETSIKYSFLHDTIPKTIYTLISYERRISLHRCLAHYYERLLDTENQSQILVKVTRHYLQTDEVSKQLYYLQELSSYNMRSYLLPEATAQLEQILTILKENDEMVHGFGWSHLSDIYYRLGVCFTMRTELNKGEGYLKMALSCLDKSWPNYRLSFFLHYMVNWLDQYKHRHWHLLWILTRQKVDSQLGKRVVDIMRQLSDIYIHTANGRSFVYTSLVGLNACESLGDEGYNYTFFLSRYSLACWLNGNQRNSVYYMTRALQSMKNNWHADTLSVCAYLYFAAGKFHDARSLAYLAIENTRTFGVVTDCQAFYRAVALIVTTRIFGGGLDDCPRDLELLELMADTARINRDYEVKKWLGIYSIGNAIVTDKMADCSSAVSDLESGIANSTDYNAIAIHGTLICYYIRKQDYDEAHPHIKAFLELLPSLTVTPNIIPIYGLIFAVMGFYMLLEDKDEHLITLTTKDGFDRFNRGVTLINNAFEQVKLWEFAGPSLYLARAFPYISTGRIVEGYLVLRHGFYEMKFINEIKFLKAYYYSILGKYAFTPADRMEWTGKAILDLHSLGVPYERYVNNDPQHYYTVGKPADYTLHTSGSQ
ncbi:hypothetical protein BC941DRAFT_411733 [Chlamydoabsidia padenii]|nr:hypothetical protein BC941DRAFT_411733 [Chlamydoabsidia padenii]